MLPQDARDLLIRLRDAEARADTALRAHLAEPTVETEHELGNAAQAFATVYCLTVRRILQFPAVFAEALCVSQCT